MGLGISRAPTPAADADDSDSRRWPLAVRPFPSSGGMDCPRGSGVLGLPDDPAVEILSLVPTDSLRELKLVSRAWRDLITDPFHRKRLPQTLEGFFHGGGDEDNYGRFTSLFRSSLPEVDPSFSFLTKLPWIERMALIDSCNGLLLFGYARNGSDRFGYIVCNPATKELVFVPSPSGSPPPAHLEVKRVMDGERHAYTFLMFDPAISSHFHLVQLWQSGSMMHIDGEEVEGVHSYSSEARGWSDRSSEWKRGEKGGEWEQWGQALVKPTFGRAFVNGMLYFLVYHVQKMEALIVAVNGEGKTCRIIRWHEKHGNSDATFIGQSQGRLHCISVDTRLEGHYPFFVMKKLSFWVLEDYDTQEWILKHSVSCSEVFGVSCSMFDFNVVAIHPDHNAVYLVQHWNNRKLVSYDMDSGELHTLRNLGHGYRSITPYVPYFMESEAVVNKY